MKMQYFEWIEQYRQNQLSPADRLVFEHELSENETLRKELNAVELTDSALVEAALSLGSIPTSVVAKKTTFFHKRKKLLFSALTILLVICPLLYFGLFSNYESSEVPQFTPERELLPEPIPEKDKIEQEDTRPVADNIQQPPSKTFNASTADARRHQNLLAETSSGKINKRALKEASREVSLPFKPAENGRKSQKIAVYKVRAVLDTVLSENSDIALTATEEVRLKPGFHAKPGTSFSARAVAGPVFDSKSLAN